MSSVERPQEVILDNVNGKTPFPYFVVSWLHLLKSLFELIVFVGVVLKQHTFDS